MLKQNNLFLLLLIVKVCKSTVSFKYLKHIFLDVRKIISTTDENKFISIFQATVSASPTDTNLTAAADVIGAVYETLRMITYKPAMLYLFSSADISSPANFMTVNNMLGKGGVQINIILQSGLTTLPTTGNYFYYQQLAISSAGRIISLTDSGTVKNVNLISF